MLPTQLADSARACLTNGRRLLDDVQYLEYQEPPATAYFIALIAQEEFAKAFLLALVVRGMIPWDRRLMRAARDHTCKQLLCLVMDYLGPDDDHFRERLNTLNEPLPRSVADAMNILRYEKIGRWDGGWWAWEDDPEYDREALAVSEGKHDRRKQDALYVRLAADGRLASVPGGVTSELLMIERKRASRMAYVAEDVLDGKDYPGIGFDKIEEAARALFASLA